MCNLGSIKFLYKIKRKYCTNVNVYVKVLNTQNCFRVSNDLNTLSNFKIFFPVYKKSCHAKFKLHPYI